MAPQLLVAGIIMSAASTVMGAMQQGAAAQAAAANSIATGEYNAKVMEINAKMALQEGEIARDLAKNRAIGKVQAGDLQIGAGKAVLGKSGVLLEGSPTDALAQIASDAAQASAMEIYTGEVEWANKQTTASIYKSRAQQERWKGYADANAYLSKAQTGPAVAMTVLGNSALAAGIGYNAGIFGTTGAGTVSPSIFSGATGSDSPARLASLYSR